MIHALPGRAARCAASPVEAADTAREATGHDENERVPGVPDRLRSGHLGHQAFLDVVVSGWNRTHKTVSGVVSPPARP